MMGGFFTQSHMSYGQNWYMAKGHPEVGGPLSVLQSWQPHDPLNTTLVIPNFVPYLHNDSI